ncbi:hypothetical protein BJY01DRAFT_218182 [Aspergillus pseudoustus]|uniref:MADS-box domain-containing protein n=1 Tax=Aspergillus pseudoustus TaxID=1810923 RepID=A0ABR4JMI2_9EURO
MQTQTGTLCQKLQKSPRASKKLIRQRRNRRKTSLIKKSFEYSTMCDADVCLGIRIRESGRVYIFSADTTGFWAFVGAQLDSYYPTPDQITEKDIISPKN